MKAIDLLLEDILPPGTQPRVLDKKGMSALATELASHGGDTYASVMQRVSDLGRNQAYLAGETLGVDDMAPTFDKESLLAGMDQELGAARAAAKSDHDYDKQRDIIWTKTLGEIDRLTPLSNPHNNVVRAVASGARGNAVQMRAMLSTPGLYTDYKGKIIPIFSRTSHGEGLRPGPYLASSYGVRSSIISTKTATAKGGDFLKQMVQGGVNTSVTEEDCGTANGIDVPVDRDVIGRVLAKEQAGYPAGTPVDREVFRALEKSRAEQVIVRSPMTCQSKHGLCSHCLGQLSGGHFAPIGYQAGITAAQAIGEPVVQGSLNCLAEGTLVRMADFTVRPIEAIRVGEWVLGSDKKGVTFPVQVLNKWDQGLQSTQRFTYKLGQTQQTITLEATIEHKLLSNKKVYGKTASPNNGKLVMLPAGYSQKTVGAVFPTATRHGGVREPLALMVGVMLGDGIRNTTTEHGLRMSCADFTQMEDLKVWGVSRNLTFTKKKRSHDWAVAMINEPMVQDPKTGRVMSGFRNPLKLRLEQLQLRSCYAHEKFVPLEVWKWDQLSVAELIAGYLATDGSVYTNTDGHIGISFASSSKQLVAGIKELLAVRLCVYGSALSQTGEAGSGNRKHDMWQLCITRRDQVERLASLLPSIPGVKEKRLRDLLKNADYLRRNTEGFYIARKIDAQPIGPNPCWDLEVDHPDHLFVLANGIICSNSKHTSGVLKGGKKVFSGFDVVSALVQSPEVFPHRAPVASRAGRVEAIDPAPQGGNYITVDGAKHYALPGYEPSVKVGDDVEAGDQLSEGVVDVADVVQHRGLGEGRRYYVDRLRQALEESGAGNPSRVNLEVLSRGTLDHLRVDEDDGIGDALPDDLISYNAMSAKYVPPKDVVLTKPGQASGKWLHAPALHYTIGTKLTPRMTERIKKGGIDQVVVSDKPPGFSPEMVRLRTASHAGTDWLAKLNTSYLTDNLAHDAERGRETNVEHNTNFAPRLAIGKDFGKHVGVKGEF